MNAVPAPMPLPHTWRPLGPRIAGAVSGAVLVVMAVVLWFTFDAETRDAITPFQRGTVIALGAVIRGATGHYDHVADAASTVCWSRAAT